MRVVKGLQDFKLMTAIGKGPRGPHVAWIVHGSQGEGFDEHDFRGHAGEVYDEALRVPLVIAVPEGKPGRYDAAAVSIAPRVRASGPASSPMRIRYSRPMRTRKGS